MADNGTQSIKLNWTKIVAWGMTTLFTLLLALVMFLFKTYATKIDDLVISNASLQLEVKTAIAVLQTQNTSTASEVSDIKDDIKEIKTDIREIRK